MDFSHSVITYIFSMDTGGGPPTTETIISGALGYDVQVLAVSMQQEKDLSTTILYCGSDVVAKNYGKDLPQVHLHYHCNSEDLYIEKTGADEATITVLYATSSQHEYMHERTIDNQLTSGDTIFISGVIIFFLSFIAWRYFKLKPR